MKAHKCTGTSLLFFCCSFKVLNACHMRGQQAEHD